MAYSDFVTELQLNAAISAMAAALDVTLIAVNTNLPAIVVGKRMIYKNTSSGSITLTANGTDTIEGASVITLVGYASVNLYGFNGVWYVV